MKSVFLSCPILLNKCPINSVTINENKYTKGTVFVANIEEDAMHFGEIFEVYNIDNKMYLLYNILSVIDFNEHYYVYTVLKNNKNPEIVLYDHLPIKSTCLMTKIKN